MERSICIDITGASGFRSNYSYPFEMIISMAEPDAIVSKALTTHIDMGPKEDATKKFMYYIRANEFVDGMVNRMKTFTITELQQAIKFLQEDSDE